MRFRRGGPFRHARLLRHEAAVEAVQMLYALDRKLGALLTLQEIRQIIRMSIEALEHFPHQRNAEHLVGHSCPLGKLLHSRMESILHLNLHTLDLHGRISRLLACGVILSKRQPFESDPKCLGQLGDNGRPWRRTALLVPGDLRSSYAAGLCQIGLAPAMN